MIERIHPRSDNLNITPADRGDLGRQHHAWNT